MNEDIYLFHVLMKVFDLSMIYSRRIFVYSKTMVNEMENDLSNVIVYSLDTNETSPVHLGKAVEGAV